jgi:hypothetical protein
MTVLHFAAQSRGNDIWELSPAIINTVNSRGMRVLHIAAEVSQKDICELIIEKFPEAVNAVDSRGMTVLHIAAQNGHNELAKLLIESSKISFKHIIDCAKEGSKGADLINKIVVDKCSALSLDNLKYFLLYQELQNITPNTDIDNFINKNFTELTGICKDLGDSNFHAIPIDVINEIFSYLKLSDVRSEDSNETTTTTIIGGDSTTTITTTTTSVEIAGDSSSFTAEESSL